MTQSRIVRRCAPTASDNGKQLLRELVEVNSAPQTLTLRPVALRSVALQRQQALGAYGLRNRVDALLVFAERIVALALIIVVGVMAARGPLYDWLHGPGVAAASVPRVKQVTAATQQLSKVAAAAPQIKQVPTAEPLLPPTTGPSPTRKPSAAKVVTALMPYPELGRALPSSMIAPVPFGAEPEDPVSARKPSFSRTSKPRAGQLVAVPKPPIEPAAPPSRLEIPTIGVDTAVVEVFLMDGTWQVADYAVGYHHGTGLPGTGNVVMAGHKGTRGAVFARLEALAPGHSIFVTAANTRYHYHVRETHSVWPSEVEVMFPTPSPTLTLLTCTNWDLQRFVVVADLVESAPVAEEQASNSME